MQLKQINYSFYKIKDILIYRTIILNYLISLIIFFPVIFSFVFKMIRIPIPSYLMVMFVSIFPIVLLTNNLLTISTNRLKFILFIFFIWILSSYIYSPSVFASKEKFISIIYNTILPIILIEIFFISKKEKIIAINSLQKTLLKHSFILLWFSFLAYIFFRVPDVSGRFSLPGLDNPIWFSRFIGMLLLVILCFSKIKMSNLFFFSITVLIAFLLLFGAGSRGPLVAVLITFFTKLSYFKSKKFVLSIVLTSLLVIILGFLFVGGYMFETDFYSLYGRLELFNNFSDYNFQYLKGTGIGSYSLLLLGKDEILYPHNIFLEIFSENGLIGLLLFFYILFLFFKSFQPNIVHLLCLYYLISSLVSGDLPGNNNLFILLFLSLYAHNNEQLILKKIIR
jgi:hypothetical protein